MKIIARECGTNKTKELIELCFKDPNAMLVVPFRRDRQKMKDRILYEYNKEPPFPIINYGEIDGLEVEDYNLYFDDFDKILANFFYPNATYVITTDRK